MDKMTKRTVRVDLGPFMTGFEMTLDVPDSQGAEDYVDRYLDAILNINLRYNCEWVFVSK